MSEYLVLFTRKDFVLDTLIVKAESAGSAQEIVKKLPAVECVLSVWVKVLEVTE